MNDNEERKERPVYTGPQTEAPISSNKIIIFLLLSGVIVVSCVLLIVVIAVTR